MDAREAARWINNEFHYKPGWTITAVSDLYLGLGMIVRFGFSTVNSDRQYALQGYPKALDGLVETYLETWTIEDYKQLRNDVVGFIVQLELHEVWEFVRIGKEMEAPFHPHKDECTTERREFWDGYVSAMMDRV